MSKLTGVFVAGKCRATIVRWSTGDLGKYRAEQH